MELWYKEPASYWEEALPLGNGRLGAMVWSGTEREKISLNEDTLWSGYPRNHDIPGASESYRQARRLAMEKKYEEAQALLEQNVLGEFTQSYLPLGELTLEMTHPEGEIHNYRRSLDLGKALSRLQYSAGEVAFVREMFISAPQNRPYNNRSNPGKSAGHNKAFSAPICAVRPPEWSPHGLLSGRNKEKKQ